MSTFMATAAVDLPVAADPGPFLDSMKLAVRDTVAVWIRPLGSTHTRISLFADGGNGWLAESIAAAPAWERALIALDHDEWGAEHLVLSNVDGAVHRVQHVYIHWGDAPSSDFEDVSLAALPPAPGLTAASDGTLNDAAAWSAVTALYDADPAAVQRAGRYAAKAHENLGTVFTPFEPFWDAVGVLYPIALGEDLDAVLLA
jgi:hypothetical protein